MQAMPSRRDLLIASLGCVPGLVPTSAHASVAIPVEVARELPGAQLRGQARLDFLLAHIYDIRLWSPMPLAPDAFWQAPLALEIEYARSLAGRSLAERSIEEMQRQQLIPEPQRQRWLAFMEQAFPDVEAGDRITGIQLPVEAVRFFLNGAYRAELRDGEFARLFFGIWLAPQTSQPRLRKHLLNLSP
jgi:hypothetical protein